MEKVGDLVGFPLEEISHEVDYLRRRSWFYELPSPAAGQPQRGTPVHTLYGTPRPLEAALDHLRWNQGPPSSRRLQWAGEMAQ